ncbi:hypothetical protein GGQ59_002223, partial [Parvularcula dongshanensis]
GWSYSGNGGGVEDLDLVLDFDPARLSPWGERLVNGPGGLRDTSRTASVFPAEEKAAERSARRQRAPVTPRQIKGMPWVR